MNRLRYPIRDIRHIVQARIYHLLVFRKIYKNRLERIYKNCIELKSAKIFNNKAIKSKEFEI